MRNYDHVLYIGPVRVEILMNYYGGVLAIADFETREILGYPNMLHGFCLLRYRLGNLNPHLQAAFRTPKILSKWSSYMPLGDDIWSGRLEYVWGIDDDVLVHLLKQRHHT